MRSSELVRCCCWPYINHAPLLLLIEGIKVTFAIFLWGALHETMSFLYVLKLHGPSRLATTHTVVLIQSARMLVYR